MVWLVKHIVVVIIICFIIISSSSSMLAARSKLSEAGDTKKILQNATILSKSQQKGKSTVHQH
jgi:Na+-transporting NADH:ubiquinone oxidoreductase subunit NqrC